MSETGKLLITLFPELEFVLFARKGFKSLMSHGEESF